MSVLMLKFSNTRQMTSVMAVNIPFKWRRVSGDSANLAEVDDVLPVADQGDRLEPRRPHGVYNFLAVRNAGTEAIKL